jgi:WhiB family redox-sensing transcriptional regulator
MPTTWLNRSACLDESPELFFPIGNTGPALDQIKEAKAVCGRCEVVEDCLNWAIEYGQDEGVWGGRPPRQLRYRRPYSDSYLNDSWILVR